MDQKTRDYWLSEEKWTPEQAVWLMVNIDPDSKNASCFVSKAWKRYGFRSEESFIDSLPRDEQTSFRDFRAVANKLIDQIFEESNYSEETLENPPSEYKLCGFTYPNHFKRDSMGYAVFPIEAYRLFAERYIFPKEGGLGINVPIFDLYHADIAEPKPIDLGVVVKGVSISDVREMIESNPALGDVLQAVN